MRSLDMFHPSGYRKKSEQPIQIMLSQKPEGKALSPFILSLRPEKSISSTSKTTLHTEDNTLQSIENLFRGDHEHIGKEYIETQSSHTPSKISSSSTISNKNQSLQAQLDAVKKAKSEYKAVFEKASRKKSGFFSLWGK